MSEAHIVGSLGELTLFDSLSPGELKALGTVIAEEEVEDGTVVFQEGQPGTCCYFIVKGRIEVAKRVAGSGVQAIATLNPGEVFGQLALVDGSPRSATCTASGACRLLRLDRREFDMLFASKSPFAFKFQAMIAMLSARQLRAANRRVNALMLAGQAGKLSRKKIKELDEVEAILARSDVGGNVDALKKLYEPRR